LIGWETLPGISFSSRLPTRSLLWDSWRSNLNIWNNVADVGERLMFIQISAVEN
jgi:hypothetical protein